MPEDIRRRVTARQPPPRERRPYEPPRIVFRQPLEALAVACAGPGSKANTIDCAPLLISS